MPSFTLQLPLIWRQTYTRFWEIYYCYSDTTQDICYTFLGHFANLGWYILHEHQSFLEIYRSYHHHTLVINQFFNELKDCSMNIRDESVLYSAERFQFVPFLYHSFRDSCSSISGPWYLNNRRPGFGLIFLVNSTLI